MTTTTRKNANSEQSEEPVPLFFGPQTESLEVLADAPALVTSSDDMAARSPHDGADVAHAHSLVGHWSGGFAYDGVDWGDGLVSFSISAHGEDGRVSGSGTDAFGPFTVEGTLEGDRLTFLKEYVILQYGSKVAWRYQGTVDEDWDGITGTWGRPNGDSQSVAGDEEGDGGEDGIVDDSVPPTEEEEGEEGVDEGGDEDGGDEDEGEDEDENGNSEDGNEEDGSGSDEEDDNGSAASIVVGGTFFLKRRPLEYLLACPPDEEFAENRPRALWKLAIKYTIRVVQRRTLSWSGLTERRRQRRRYIELVRFKQRFRMDSTRAREWGELVRGIHPDDLHLWHCIAMFQERRDPLHL